MSTDRDDRWDDGDDRGYRDDDDRRPRVDVDAVRRRVSMPARLLIIFGLVGILFEVITLVTAFTNPNYMADQFQKFIESQPPGPQKQEMLDDFEQEKDTYRLDTPSNLGTTILGLVLSVLMVAGGAKMSTLSGYGLALTGAICGVIPFNGCCCCAMPVGIWALIVLANSDVKAAFRSTASTY